MPIPVETAAGSTYQRQDVPAPGLLARVERSGGRVRWRPKKTLQREGRLGTSRIGVGFGLGRDGGGRRRRRGGRDRVAVAHRGRPGRPRPEGPVAARAGTWSASSRT